MKVNEAGVGGWRWTARGGDARACALRAAAAQAPNVRGINIKANDNESEPKQPGPRGRAARAGGEGGRGKRRAGEDCGNAGGVPRDGRAPAYDY